MIARKYLPAPLQRRVYSFLVEGNLDLNFFNNGVYDAKKPSSLATIRRINKISKEVTQQWQDAFAELKDYLADPDFKKFYLRVVNFSYDSDTRTLLLLKDLLLPLLNLLHAEQHLTINTLKNALKECTHWENRPEQPSDEKDHSNTGTLELRKFYANLNRLRIDAPLYMDEHEIVPLSKLQHQFQFLLLEHIVLLLFKNKNQPVKQSLQINTNKSEPSAYEVMASYESRLIKVALLCFIIPSIIGASLAGALMPDDDKRNGVLALTINTAVVGFSLCVCGLDSRRKYLQRNRTYQQFSTDYLNQAENRHRIFNQNRSCETKTEAEVKIDIQPLETPLQTEKAPDTEKLSNTNNKP